MEIKATDLKKQVYKLDDPEISWIKSAVPYVSGNPLDGEYIEVTTNVGSSLRTKRKVIFFEIEKLGTAAFVETKGHYKLVVDASVDAASKKVTFTTASGTDTTAASTITMDLKPEIEDAINHGTFVTSLSSLKAGKKTLKLGKVGKGILIGALAVGLLATAAVGTTEGLVNNYKNFSGHSLDEAVVAEVSKDLNLNEKTLSTFANNYNGVVYSVGNPWVVGATPLDVLKGNTLGKHAGEYNFAGKKSYSKENKQVLAEDIAFAMAKDVIAEYDMAGKDIDALNPQYPITVNNTDASKTEGFVEILQNINLENANGAHSKLSESQINAILDYYQTFWEEEATKITEKGALANANAQAAANAKANATAQAEASIDAAIRSEFSSTVGEYDIDWNTGKFVAWSADEDREFRYSGQSDALIKNFENGETITPEEIAAAIDGAEITKGQKLENYIGDLFGEGKTYSDMKEKFETKLGTKRDSDQIKYAADRVDYYVDLDTTNYAADNTMTVTYYVDCYKQNENTKAYEYSGSSTVEGKTVVTNGVASPDARVGTAMSMFDRLTFKNSGISREEDVLVK